MFPLDALASFWPHFAQVKANGAAALFLASLSLVLQLPARANRAASIAACAAAAIAASFGLATLAECAVGMDLGMAPATAVGIAALGLGLASFGSQRAAKLSEALLVFAGVAGLTAIAGPLFYVGEPNGSALLYRPMELPTALAVSLLGLGALLARPQRVLVSILVDRGRGGAAARALLPAAIAVPLLLGWLRLRAERAGMLDPSAGAVVFAVATVLILAPLVFWNSALLIRSERVEEESNRQTSLFRSVLDTLGDGVIATDRERGFLIFNPAAEQILGPRQPGAKPEDWSTAYGLYQEDGVTPFPIEDLPISRAVRGESTNDVELVVREPARGCDAWVRVTGRPLRDATGVISGGVVVFSEVTAAKLAEIQMRDLNGQLTSRTRELESANREMQAFSYSISHDLRAPLRAIDGFSRVLLQDCADQLDDVGKRHLGRVCAATQRMSALIDALLGLARISHGGMELRRVDLSGLADEIAAELGAGESGRSVAFTIARGLEAVGDQRLLRAALENLIGNAWKFTSRRKAARIEVGSERHGGETAYFVRDDGVGFDMRHAKRLFAAFQRMHSVGDFDGTGIGLATVARIVSRHGGRIWAEAEVERGATFWFTLAAGERPATQ